MSETAINIIIQAIGFVGLSFAVIAYQCKKHKTTMLFKGLQELIIALQYLALGAYTGVAMNTLGCVRNLLFGRLVEKGRSTRVAQIIIGAIFIAFGILTWHGPVSIFAMLGKAGETAAFGIKSPKVMRLVTLPTLVCWLIYNITCRSIAAILCDVFSICSILIYFYKTRRPAAEDGQN